MANAVDRPMAQVALNWVANRPGVASVIVGASQPVTPFPYYFFTNAMQGMMYGGATVGDKPAGYRAPVRVRGTGSGVE